MYSFFILKKGFEGETGVEATTFCLFTVIHGSPLVVPLSPHSHRDMHDLLSFLSSDVYLSLNGDIIPNHGYVLIDDIGSTNTDALLCLTNGVAITDDINTEGNWFSPNGVRVTNEFHQDVPGFRRTRSMAVVRLLHQDTGTAATEGIYHCNVQDAIPVLRTVYVGLYNSGGGNCNGPCTCT